MKWKYVFIGASLLLGACQPMGNKQADATKPSTETVSKDKRARLRWQRHKEIPRRWKM